MSKDTLYPIELTKEQKDWLKEQATKEDRSMAWVIRKLIDGAKSNQEEVAILRDALSMACKYGNFDNGISNITAQTGISLYGYFYSRAQDYLKGRGTKHED